MTDREGGQRRLEEEGCPESTDAKGWGGSRTDVEARVGSPEDRVYVISRIVRECQSCATVSYTHLTLPTKRIV